MSLNLTFDATVNATQQTALQAIANFFNAHFTDPVTTDIAVSFAALGPGGLGASSYSLVTHSFTDITNALANDATSAADASSVANLPGADPITGTHSWTMTPAEEMALGLIADNGTANDGSVRFSNSQTFDYDRTDGITAGAYDFWGVVAHEFTEIMGRELNAIGNNVASGPGYHPLDLFKFSAANTAEFVGTNAGYFSVDGGTTKLVDFNTSVNGDFGDWAGTAGNNSFLAFSPSGVFNLMSLADLSAMDVIGWEVTESAPTVTAFLRSVGEDGPMFSQDLLQGSADTDNDPLFLMNLDTVVSTTGTSAVAPTLFLGTDYTISNSTLSLTSAGFAKFDSLASGQSATAIFDYDVSDGITTTHNTLSVTVNGANDGPVAVADIGIAGENETKSFDVLANDTDVDVGDVKTLLSPLGSVSVSSGNTVINGIDASGAFAVVGNQISFTPGTLFDHLAVGDTATVVVNYTMEDSQHATSSSTLTLTVNGENDAPVILSGGAGDAADYFVRVHETAITKVVATDVDGDNVTFSIVGGADASRFVINSNTGQLSFGSTPNQPHNAYQVTVQASDGHGGLDTQDITVSVAAAKMAADGDADTFVFHANFGSNEISNFDLDRDFLQFDQGMFSADDAAAVLAAAHDDHHGNTVIDVHAGHLVIDNVSVAQLQAHANDFLFV